MLVLQKGLILPVPMYGGSYFFIQPFCERYKPCKMLKKDALLVYFDMYPEFWTHIYKLGGHHGCFSVFYRRHPFCFCLDSFAIIVINIFINSNCKFFK